MLTYIVRANGSCFHVSCDDLSHDDVEASCLISVELEVRPGGNVYSANSLPRRLVGAQDELVRARLSVVGGHLWAETSHDHWTDHRQLADCWPTSATVNK